MFANHDNAAYQGNVADGLGPESSDPRLHASVELLAEAIDGARQVLEIITSRLRVE